MTLQKPARLLVEHARSIILKRYRRDSCIASTAIGIAVMKRFGIDAWPVPVAMSAYNPLFQQMVQEYDGDTAQVPHDQQMAWRQRGAWAVVIDEDDSTNDGTRFRGHLVMGVDGYLIDLSLDQAARPHKNMHLRPHSFETPHGFYTGTEPSWGVLDGTLVVYRHRPSNDNYASSPDWRNRNGRLDLVVESVENKIRNVILRDKRRR